MNADDKTLKALGDLVKNYLLKSLMYVIFFLVISVITGKS